MTPAPHPSPRRGLFTRNAVGTSSAEAFMMIAIATILVTRAYLWITDYPQVGGGNLHIAHALYGGGLMMLALLMNWWFLGYGSRVLTVLFGGIGFGLFLDEVGKFVTKDNDYFYGPSAEIMYVLVIVVIIVGRIMREVRPLSADENLASAASIAADGVARGLQSHRRELALRMVERADELGSDPAATQHIRALLIGAPVASARLHALGQWAPRLIPSFFRRTRWLPIVCWLMVVTASVALIFTAVGITLNGVYYESDDIVLDLDGRNASGLILLVSAAITLAFSIPAMIARKRTDKLWPLQFLRYGALVFTMLNALVDFAVDGFGALVNLGIGLFTLAIISYHLSLRARAENPKAYAEAVAADDAAEAAQEKSDSAEPVV
ncbi:hypothetical protein [Williamsia sp.]|uniref:hypothetical protein n=1 Tax=Williamsia sp. TaxID=1872085 RepID=UPI0039C918CD